MTAHATHDMHANSVASYHRLDLGARERSICRTYERASMPLTDREVADRLGYHDMNAVRPSITRLLSLGTLVACPSVKDSATNRTVRTVTLALPAVR